MIADLIDRAGALSLLWWITNCAFVALAWGLVALFLARWADVRDRERGR